MIIDTILGLFLIFYLIKIINRKRKKDFPFGLLKRYYKTEVKFLKFIMIVLLINLLLWFIYPFSAVIVLIIMLILLIDYKKYLEIIR